jgi:hypothetical protein
MVADGGGSIFNVSSPSKFHALLASVRNGF